MPILVPKSGDASIDGVLWGYKWDFPNLTYQFPTTINVYQGYNAVVGFEAFNANQQKATERALKLADGYCGLVITKETNPNAVANLRFAEATQMDYNDGRGLVNPGGSNQSAEANPPDPTIVAHAQGDSWFNKTSYNNPLVDSFAWSAGIAHELGHNLGLKHGHSAQEVFNQFNQVLFTNPTLPGSENSQEYSIMTYTSAPNNPSQDNSVTEYPSTFMQNDIAALQYMYGADYTSAAANAGNTVYTFSTTTGEMFINNVGQGHFSHRKLFLTIWDGGGADWLSFANYTTAARINLNPGQWSTPSNAQRAELLEGVFARGCVAMAQLYRNDGRSLIENALGGSNNDVIFGNRANNYIDGNAGNDIIMGFSGNDRLIGDGGNDRIAGNAGRDIINGGSGADTFVYMALSDLTKSFSTTDQIMDFQRGDRISLDFDANILAAGVQNFRLVSGYTGSAGQLLALKNAATPGVVYVAGDVNGDRASDFFLIVRGVSSLGAGDFIL
jgi:serralysin